MISTVRQPRQLIPNSIKLFSVFSILAFSYASGQLPVLARNETSLIPLRLTNATKKLPLPIGRHQANEMANSTASTVQNVLASQVQEIQIGKARASAIEIYQS